MLPKPKLGISEIGLWVQSDFHNLRVKRLLEWGEFWGDGEKSALADVAPAFGENSRWREFERRQTRESWKNKRQKREQADVFRRRPAAITTGSNNV